MNMRSKRLKTVLTLKACMGGGEVMFGDDIMNSTLIFISEYGTEDDFKVKRQKVIDRYLEENGKMEVYEGAIREYYVIKN